LIIYSYHQSSGSVFAIYVNITSEFHSVAMLIALNYKQYLAFNAHVHSWSVSV